MTKSFFCYRRGYFVVCGKVYISVFSIISALCIVLSESSIYPLYILLCALCHELGHIASLLYFGAPIKRITVYPFGADMTADTSHISYKKEAVVMLSGALVNLALSFCFGLTFTLCKSPHLLFLCLCNCFFALSNLLPIKSLDGGRALLALLCNTLPPYKALFICNGVSAVCYVILCLCFAAVACKTQNTALFIILAYSALGIAVSSKLS